MSKQNALELLQIERKNLAIDILEDSDVISEFDDTIWLSINKSMLKDFNKTARRYAKLWNQQNKAAG